MNKERFNAELRTLAQYFGKQVRPPKNWSMSADDRLRWLEMGVSSQSGKRYTIHIRLDGFPEVLPKVYIKSPRPLRDCRGNALGCSGAMHVLPPDSDGSTQVCHYGATQWSANTGLVKVVLRVLLWLNAYEMHLQTGRNIDSWLNHAG